MHQSITKYRNLMREYAQSKPTGDWLLDKAFRITEMTAIRTDNTIAGFAVCLQIARARLEQGSLVIFIDQALDGFDYKMKDLLSNPYFFIMCPTNPIDIVNASKKIKGLAESVPRTYIFSQSYWSSNEIWKVRKDYTEFAETIKKYDPHAYLVFEVMPHRIKPSQGWNVVDIVKLEDDWVTGEKTTNVAVGFTIQVHKPDGLGEVITHYIERYTNNLSKAWTRVQQDMQEDGISPNSVFESDDGTIKAQGYMKFVRESNKKLKE